MGKRARKLQHMLVHVVSYEAAITSRTQGTIIKRHRNELCTSTNTKESGGAELGLKLLLKGEITDTVIDRGVVVAWGCRHGPRPINIFRHRAVRGIPKGHSIRR